MTTLLIAAAALDAHTPKRNGKRVLPAHQRAIDDLQRAIDDLQRAIDTHPNKRTGDDQ